MKRVLPNNGKTKKYLETLPSLYIVACWAGFGVRDYPYSGKCNKEGLPYVWDYYDGNGTCDEWHLVPLPNVTSGTIYACTTSLGKAKKLAEAMNHLQGEDWRNETC